MSIILDYKDITPAYAEITGGKAQALARMDRNRIPVPLAICVTTEAYDRFLDSQDLRGQILFELERKKFEDLRWEEIWDISLRIKNIFLSKPIPKSLNISLSNAINSIFTKKSVVVRSSSLQEDSSKASFAGLHESYVNITGTKEILKHIKLVWASLWSDAAILYRQELGLSVSQSKMAVVVQELIPGEASGIIFTQAPQNPDCSMIEAVYGLNQGLVDGSIEPDQWLLVRKTGKILSHSKANRIEKMVAGKAGITQVKLQAKDKNKSPMLTKDIKKVFILGKNCEQVFKSPQDIEWTMRDKCLFALQSRAITTIKPKKGDNRSWYLSLKRSMKDLKELRIDIEEKYIPQMDNEAKVLSKIQLDSLSDVELAKEIVGRQTIMDKWNAIYWEYFIPMAHGMRLFGEFYNRAINPDDPHEFMKLLENTPLKSVERNRKLASLANYVGNNPRLAKKLKSNPHYKDKDFEDKLDTYLNEFADFDSAVSKEIEHRAKFIGLILEMSSGEFLTKNKNKLSKSSVKEEKRFLANFRGDKRLEAAELLDLAKASYRLRDDDNIYLGKIENELNRATQIGKRLLKKRLKVSFIELSIKEIIKALSNSKYTPKITKKKHSIIKPSNLKARQLTGQPAGAGISIGKARVIVNPEDVLEFKTGEIIVCDAIEPNMTFVIPMAKAIVERRGGMLIHGAIIAREYGLPCVTGVPDATTLIKTGNNITVDGYLGIITITKQI